MYLVRSWKIAEQAHKSHQRHLSVMLLMNRSRWKFRFGLRGGKWIGLIFLEPGNVGTSHQTWCNLIGTKVTDAGVADLQKALPNCKIEK
jgi:hypothetical protein